MFSHVSNSSRLFSHASTPFHTFPPLERPLGPLRHRTQFWLFLATKSIFCHVSIGSCPFGHVSTPFHTFAPLPGRLAPLRHRTQFWPFLVDYSSRFSGVPGDFATTHPNRCFH